MLFLALVLVCPRNMPVWCFSVKKWQHGFERMLVSHTVSLPALMQLSRSFRLVNANKRCVSVVLTPVSSHCRKQYISAVQSWNWGKRNNMLESCPLCHPLFIPPLPSLPLFSVPLPPFLCAPFLYRVENATNTHFLNRLFSATASSFEHALTWNSWMLRIY